MRQTILVLIFLGFNIHVFANRKPNILFLLADDWGWVDLSTGLTNFGNGSKYYETPHLDRLAEKAACFNSMYVYQNCAPTRAALISGQYAPRTRMYNVESLDRGETNSLIKPISQTTSLDTGLVSIAEALKTGGYATAHFGKWGVGNRQLIEDYFGFDVSYSTTLYNQTQKKGMKTGYFPVKDDNGTLNFNMYGDMRGSLMNQFTQPYTREYIAHYLQPYTNGNNPAILENTPKHLTDAMADATQDFLKNWSKKSNGDHPFFMYVAFNQVHVPIEPRKDLEEKYTRKISSDSRHKNPQYAAFVEQLDQVCARIIDQLKDPNGDGDNADSVWDNTIIIFTSDNGGLGSITDNSPLRGSKGMQYDGGIRVPLIVSGPGIQKGVYNTLLHVVDFYPTLLDAAGIKTPDADRYPLDGVSFWPTLLSKTAKAKRDAIFYHFPGYMDKRSVPTSYVIQDVGADRYKLFYFYEKQQYELYQLNTDISEKNNLLTGNVSGKEKEIAVMMQKRLVNWLKESNAEPMTYRDSGKPVPIPVPIRFDNK